MEFNRQGGCPIEPQGELLTWYLCANWDEYDFQRSVASSIPDKLGMTDEALKK
jgi:hypothetical protein